MYMHMCMCMCTYMYMYTYMHISEEKVPRAHKSSLAALLTSPLGVSVSPSINYTS